MKPEEKDLLLKDLCARVPYHPKGHVVNACNGAQCDEWLTCATFTMFTNVTNNSRLYLRPMSSMTEEEEMEFTKLFDKWHDEELFDYIEEGAEFSIWKHKGISPIVFDWLNAHHFDFRNLIERGLAIAVTEENNPYK